MFDGRFRSSVDRGVGPIGAALGKTGLSPDHLTALGLVMAVPAAFAIGSGRLLLGLVLLIVSSVPDLLDGALAKAKGTSSIRGAFFDSVADRVTDAVIMGGVAWYLQSSRHGHAGLLPFGILAVSTLISYERAKAESLGFTAKGGLMERAERIILLCVGLVAPVILVPILWIMLILTGATAVQRFAKVWRQATDSISTGSGEAASGGAPSAAGAASASVGESGAAGSGSGAGAGTGAAEARAAGASATGPGAATDDVAGVPEAGASGAAGAGAAVVRGAAGSGWRQQNGVRQARATMAAASRPSRVGHESAAGRRATRWEERRAARLRAVSDSGSGSATSSGEKDSRRASDGRGRHTTRRP